MTTETLCKLYLELAHVVPYSTKTYRDIENENKVKSALRHLDFFGSGKRNGPFYQAVNDLRWVLRLSPIVPGGKPSEGIDAP